MPVNIKFIKPNTKQNALRSDKIPFGEALHKKHFTDEEYFFKAQNRYKRKDEMDRNYTGDAKHAIGHLCISRKDYEKLTVKPEKNDIITSISGVSVRYKIVEIRPAGHINLWSKTAEHTIYLIFYEQDKEKYAGNLKSI